MHSNLAPLKLVLAALAFGALCGCTGHDNKVGQLPANQAPPPVAVIAPELLEGIWHGTLQSTSTLMYTLNTTLIDDGVGNIQFSGSDCTLYYNDPTIGITINNSDNAFTANMTALQPAFSCHGEPAQHLWLSNNLVSEPLSLSGTFKAGASITATFQAYEAAGPILESYDPVYTTPATLARIAGSYKDPVVDPSGNGLPVTATVDAEGNLTATEQRASYQGKLTPHGAGAHGIYDVTLTVTSTQLASGTPTATFTGLATLYEYNGVKDGMLEIQCGNTTNGAIVLKVARLP